MCEELVAVELASFAIEGSVRVTVPVQCFAIRKDDHDPWGPSERIVSETRTTRRAVTPRVLASLDPCPDIRGFNG